VDLLSNGQFDGKIVSLTSYNTHDWTITSEISGTFLYVPPGHQDVPEPAPLLLLASGIAGWPRLPLLPRLPFQMCDVSAASNRRRARDACDAGLENHEEIVGAICAAGGPVTGPKAVFDSVRKEGFSSHARAVDRQFRR
jgi:hypothetical protein